MQVVQATLPVYKKYKKHSHNFSYFTIDVLSSDEAEIEKVRFAAKFTHFYHFR
jgi:hypothetical protein